MIHMTEGTSPGDAPAVADLSKVYDSWMWIRHGHRVHIVSTFCADFPLFISAAHYVRQAPDAPEPITSLLMTIDDPVDAGRKIYGKGTAERPFHSPWAEARPFPECQCGLPIPHVLAYEYPPEGGTYATIPGHGRLLVKAPGTRTIVPNADLL